LGIWLLFVFFPSFFLLSAWLLRGDDEKKERKNTWVLFGFLAFWLLGTLRFADFGFLLFVFCVFPDSFSFVLALRFLLVLFLIRVGFLLFSLLELELARIVEVKA
jgi:hypothetical protein